MGPPGILAKNFPHTEISTYSLFTLEKPDVQESYSPKVQGYEKAVVSASFY